MEASVAMHKDLDEKKERSPFFFSCSHAIPARRQGHALSRRLLLAASPGGMRCRRYNYGEAAWQHQACPGF